MYSTVLYTARGPLAKLVPLRKTSVKINVNQHSPIILGEHDVLRDDVVVAVGEPAQVFPGFPHITDHLLNVERAALPASDDQVPPKLFQGNAHNLVALDDAAVVLDTSYTRAPTPCAVDCVCARLGLPY